MEKTAARFAQQCYRVAIASRQQAEMAHWEKYLPIQRFATPEEVGLSLHIF